MKAAIMSIAVALFLFAGSPKDANGQTYVYTGTQAGVQYGWGYFHVGIGVTYFPFYGYGYWLTPGAIANHAAIAYSPSTGQVGWSWGKTTKWHAAKWAEVHCAAADCTAVVWVQGGCASVAVSEEEGELGWAYHGKRWAAINSALEACSEAGGESCKPVAWVCSG